MKNIKSIRPSNGLPPEYLPNILSKRASRDIPAGEPLDWAMIR